MGYLAVILRDLFLFVYSIYIKLYNYFNPLPEQLLSYDKKTDRILVHGNIGYSPKVFSIDYFKVEGRYLIEFNDQNLKTYMDGQIKNSDPDYTYFLHRNNLVVEEDNSVVIIKNYLTDHESKYLFKKGEIVDFLKLVSEQE